MFKIESSLKRLLLLTTLFIIVTQTATADRVYRFRVDLTDVKRDKIKIILEIPEINDSEEVIYVIPAAVPGSYAIKNYGRFIDDFTAYDADNKKLKVSKKNDRDFLIAHATHLARIEYTVNDTWDDKNSINPVFQSGGSNIEAGKNFVINNFAFFGYIEGIDLPYEITYKKPAEFYGSSFLKGEKISDSEVKYKARNYGELADNPVMFCIPDTTSFQVSESTIYISVYSASGKVHSAELKKHLQKLMNGMNAYLGKLPVSEYHFLFYFASAEQKILTSSSGLSGFGALEHKNCSFYFLNEPQYEADLEKEIPHICAHEFLHTLTPLHFHSKEIEYFNYRFPEMSQHLWLYEGVTEYFSQQLLLKSGMMTEQDFLDVMSEKIESAAQFPLFAMTEMSKNVLLPQQQAWYLDVYSKGALLAWFLDMQIISLTHGKMDLLKTVQQLMTNMGQKSFPESFNDDDLIPALISITHPDLQPFFDNYITGKKAVDYKTLLSTAGYKYVNDEFYDIYKSGPVELQFFPDQHEIRLMNDNAHVGFLPGDVLKSMNGNAVARSNIYRLFNRYFVQNISPEKITIVITRNDQEITLISTPQLRNDKVTYLIVPDKNAGEEELMVKKVISGQ